MTLPNVVQLKEFESSPLFETSSRGVGTYTQVGEIEGNSILSSIFIKSIDAGATLKINYYDTTTGAADGERFDLTGHDLVSGAVAGTTYRTLVTKIHHRVVAEAIVAGGNVEFSLYATVVSSTASDLDQSLIRDGDDFHPTTTRGIPAAAYDDVAGKMFFLRGTAGVIDVNDVGSGGTSGTTASFTGSVGTSPVNVPAVAGNAITDILVRAASDQLNTKRLLVSLDGTTYFTLLPGEFIGWSLKGAPTQIKVKGNVAAVAYEITMNRTA